jgi:hypothetical protein
MVLNNFWFQFQHPKNVLLENNNINIFILIKKISRTKILFLTFLKKSFFQVEKWIFLKIKKRSQNQKMKENKSSIFLWNQVPFLLKSPFFGVMNTQDQKINSL